MALHLPINTQQCRNGLAGAVTVGYNFATDVTITLDCSYRLQMDTAGHSADDVARAARAKAQRLLRRAASFERGAEGERVVAALLTQLPPEWFVLNDLHWPGREKANIDHVVVGPTGVFVIDAKNWSGSVKVSNGCLRQNGYSRRSATDGGMEAARAIGALLPSVNPRHVVPVICFVGEAGANGTVDGVWICTSGTLLSALQAGRPVLSAEQREFIRYDLDMSTDNASESTAHRHSVISPTKRTHPSQQAKTKSVPRRRMEGRLNIYYVASSVVRVILSFFACAIGLSLASFAVGPVSNYRDNVVAPTALIVGGLCGWLVWRRLPLGRQRSLGPHA